MYTQQQVAKAWSQGTPARGSNMHTDGLNVWSYDWHLIGWTDVAKKTKNVYVCSYSTTTRGKHVNNLLKYADKLHPDDHTNKAGLKLIKEWAS